MNDPRPHPTPDADADPWTLEVVRGAHAGRRHQVGLGTLVLGGVPAPAAGEAGLALADQEGASPRRMAARHAAIARDGAGDRLILRDLGSPGGTFVAGRRVLPGVAQPLADGDLIQLGAVQLRLTRYRPSPLAPVVAPVPFRYETGAGGATCRTWDDFLAVSAQRWDELREDLTSGRLGAFAASVGRPDLAPGPGPDDDERLDAWLARLPTRSPAAPELEVHPPRLTIAVPAGGVTVARKVRVSNVGHRLLRARVEVEVAGDRAGGVRAALGPAVAGRELVVRDAVDVPFEVAVPESFAGPAVLEVVVRGAGQERRVRVEIARKVPSAGDGPAAEVGPVGGTIPAPVAAFLALGAARRLAIAALAGLAARLMIGVAGGAMGADAMAASGPDVPGLAGVALAFAAAGAAVVGGALGRRSGRADAAAGAVAGAGLGTLLAASAVATCRAVEPALGPLAGQAPVVLGLWAALGAGAAAATLAVSPPTDPESPR